MPQKTSKSCLCEQRDNPARTIETKTNYMRQLLLFTCCLIAVLARAQTVSEVLQKGEQVEKDKKIFFQKDGGTLIYDINNVGSNFSAYKDSTLFLIHKSGVNVLLPPLNPLRFSYDTATTVVPDPILADADKAFSSITSLLSKVAAAAPSDTVDTQCKCRTCDLTDIAIKVPLIMSMLDTGDLKSRISNVFTKLRDLDFVNQIPTEEAIKSSKDSIAEFSRRFDLIAAEIKVLETYIEKLSKCEQNDALVDNYVANQLYVQIQNTYSNKRKRLANLIKAFDAVNTMYIAAANPSPAGSSWYTKPVNIVLQDKSITYLAIIVNNSGMELKDDEIVQTEKKQYFKKVLRFRRFQRFVPEASAGVAYTDLSFPKYGTSNNGNGDLVVASAGEEKFKKLNLTAMINWNYYIENSDVNPFIQAGVGANADYPVLLLGIGFRLNSGLKRLAFSVGGASSWIKKLNKLKIGDKVSGTADIEKDYIYDFKKPKIYFGIQYNL